MSGNLSIPHPQKSKTLSRAVLVTGIALLLTGAIPFGMHGDSDSFPPASPESATTASPDPSLTPADLRLLDDIQSRALVYFVDHTDPRTGLTRDRAPANGLPSSAPASIGASGFALAAWTIAVDRGWLPPEAGRREVTSTLSFLLNGADQVHGWFYHYVDVHTGRRAWHSEVSTIDTALLLQGALFAREYFRDPQITTLVDALYRRVDWTWALDGGTTLSLGWRPETGFLPYRWNTYSELLGMVLLGIGAPEHALPPSAWDAWNRGPVVRYDGITYVGAAPLFTHQYSQAFFDFRNRRDEFMNYWQNSVDATFANRAWCADQSSRFPSWSQNLWGLTSSDSAEGYRAWGGPEPDTVAPDGTLVPCAPGGSLPFAPRECLDDLEAMRRAGGSRVWGTYGFADAFNPQTGWVSSDVIAIDQGIMLLMAENLRSGLVWRTFMRAPEVQRALDLAGFTRPGEGRD
ncbi:hypothetical protein GALL_277280 [mine drainage metagenome]|uniref:Glycoamylase-like domain-containing protein n=1 Tax=mine drainage metagenome TaxID=410659 RepID=A0A1J5R360_9ZZZZ